MIDQRRIGMKVELIDCSHNALGNIVLAARGCFGNNKKKNPTYEDDVNLVRALIKQDHSPIEFAWAMFRVSGISRACCDQLTRYRLASFAVQSQRYTNISDNEFIHPVKVLELAGDSVMAMTAYQTSLYQALIDRGIAKEDARFYLGIGFSTDLCFACNFRELRHILKQRLDKHAQWEIRKLAKEIYNICADRWPWLVESLED